MVIWTNDLMTRDKESYPSEDSLFDQMAVRLPKVGR